MLSAVLLVVIASFGLWVPEADACGRSQCALVSSCFQCDPLILLIIECEVQLCNFCVNDFCDGEGPSSLEAGAEQASLESSCSPPEAAEPAPIRVLEVEWQEDRT